MQEIKGECKNYYFVVPSFHTTFLAGSLAKKKKNGSKPDRVKDVGKKWQTSSFSQTKLATTQKVFNFSRSHIQSYKCYEFLQKTQLGNIVLWVDCSNIARSEEHT